MVYDLISAGLNKSFAMNQKIRKIIFMAEDTMGEQAAKRAGLSIKIDIVAGMDFYNNVVRQNQ